MGHFINWDDRSEPELPPDRSCETSALAHYCRHCQHLLSSFQAGRLSEDATPPEPPLTEGSTLRRAESKLEPQ